MFNHVYKIFKKSNKAKAFSKFFDKEISFYKKKLIEQKRIL